MNIEVGQWYRCRDDEFLGHVVGKVFNDTYPYAVVLYCDGDYENSAAFSLEGRYSLDLKSDFDLIEHLPDCTGPEWTPQKWRKATPEDAALGKHCRATDERDAFCTDILGFKRDGNHTFFYIVRPSGYKAWYEENQVEVLDD